MGFSGVYSAIYDYQPQSEGELEIKEGELLYILDKTGEDGWWKAKKRASDDEEEEPVGLIPENYVEQATPVASAKALYDYSRQTDEEVSFPEDTNLDVYDTSDPDWTLVGVNEDFGFAPSNYIEIGEAAQSAPPLEPEPVQTPPSPEPSPPVSSGPAAALARALGGQNGVPATSSPPAIRSLPPRTQYTPEPSEEPEEEPPALPRRPPSEQISPPANAYPSPKEDESTNAGVLPSPPYNRAVHGDQQGVLSPGGYRMYNISEMVSAMGKRKKMPITLGINMATGLIMLSPEKTRDGATQEWPADQLTHYSIEGKHIFIELVRPSKSLDLHAGSKETANEIVSVLGELAGAVRGEGIREVIAAANGAPQGQKKGQMLYEFMAQGDDEVTVAVGDEVFILDDKNEEWWLVRRLKNGKEGVVPSSYVEVSGFIPAPSGSTSGINAGRSTVEQNRLEEERMAKEMARADRKRKEHEAKHNERSKRDGRSDKSSKPKPDPTKTRTWTDRSNTFKVEAQFIGISDGKIHLHKVNGVKIAVPIAKMSTEDIEYVEERTGATLDEDKPLSDIQRRNKANGHAGASIEHPKPPEYDWFDFFLKAGVGPYQCERYSQNFNRDSMDESILPDITPETLRTLGLKEGDILRVMKYLDNKYGRTGTSSKLRNVSFAEDGADGEVNGSGGLFSGPGGTLRNNTSKGRPKPARQASDVVDPKAFEQAESTKAPPPEAAETPLAAAPPPQKTQSGFDDDAWDIKRPKEAALAPQPTPAKAASPPPATTAPSAPAQNPLLTGALAQLSLLSPPLEPTPAAQPQAPPTIPQPVHNLATQPPAQPQQPQPTGANPAFFSQLNPQQTGLPQNIGQSSGMPQQMPPRQRPQPPQNLATSSLIAPPPRPLSAPQNFQQQNQFGPPPLQPQLTGIPHNAPLQAPPGQSMNDLTQQRFQQQYGQPQLQSQQTGFPQQGQGFAPFQNGIMSQQTGFGQQPGFQQQQFMSGNQQGSPFADPQRSFSPLGAQQTGFGGFQQQQPMQTGINSVLPPALQPQQTGFTQSQQTGFQPQQLQPQQTGFQPQQQHFQPQATGLNGFGGQNQSFSQPPPPVPPLPPMPTGITPLQPQKTGAPPVRFGVSEQKKLVAQPTGRRANLAHATPDNPFGF
ncbi:putative cytoskeleton assembly control protein sla1 [Phaeomoniella chlamydospora]|uniref:Actin cytoskeleton-regulatory complex protein SLA1 n=1 Tax=Phaeomoniella chlamydospora TaxID=158046 RepID=A0A0G2E035_PHACM|nr:putative cytoskeleton assembly control protein sla1 [Phaeomoniella chlamydospora]